MFVGLQVTEFTYILVTGGPGHLAILWKEGGKTVGAGAGAGTEAGAEAGAGAGAAAEAGAGAGLPYF